MGLMNSVGVALLLGWSVLVVPPASAAEAADPCATPTIVGTDSHDHIVGSEAADVIAALDGHDVVEGLGGDDVICGGEGG